MAPPAEEQGTPAEERAGHTTPAEERAKHTTPAEERAKRASRSHYTSGLRDSIGVALGYFAVALAFGLYAARGGVPVWAAGLVSATNLSSSGQFAGITVVLASGSLLQLGLTVAVVNLRYVLMALSLAQRLEPGVGVWGRLAIGYGITDEIYALAMARPVVQAAYYLGLVPLPVLGWTGGTVVGALVGQLLPASLQAAFGVLLYGMFVAIVVPVAKRSRAVAGVVLGAAGLGVLLALLPVTAGLQPGWRIIVVTLVVAGVAAVVAPVGPVAFVPVEPVGPVPPVVGEGG